MSMLIISQTLPFTGKQSEFTHSFKYYFLCSNFLFIRKFVHSFVTFLVQARKVRNINRKININLFKIPFYPYYNTIRTLPKKEVPF